jgi:hypothetical protein
MPQDLDPITEAPPASEAPAVIHLPPPAPEPLGNTGGALAKAIKGRKGRHFGPRRVADPKDRVITFRCTVAEYELFENNAAAAGLAIGPYLRQRETGSPGPRSWRKATELAKAVAQLAAQLGKPGGLLNQGIHAANRIALAAEGGEGAQRLADLVEEMLDLLRPAVAELRECLAVAMRLLGMRAETMSEDRDY